MPVGCPLIRPFANEWVTAPNRPLFTTRTGCVDEIDLWRAGKRRAYRQEHGGILVSRILHQRMLPERTSSTIKSTSPNLSRPSRNPTQAQAPAPLDSHAFKIFVLK